MFLQGINQQEGEIVMSPSTNDEKFEALKIENQICFPLYASSRCVIKQYTPFLEAIDLTYTQYITMLVLWERKKLNVKQLGQYLYLDSGTLTPLLKKLEKKGLISRHRSLEDERNLIITITEEGEKLREKAVDIPPQMFEFCPLSEEEVKTLSGLLYKILDQSGE